MTTRRGFLQQILMAGVAPALIPFGSLMKPVVKRSDAGLVWIDVPVDGHEIHVITDTGYGYSVNFVDPQTTKRAGIIFGQRVQDELRRMGAIPLDEIESLTRSIGGEWRNWR